MKVKPIKKIKIPLDLNKEMARQIKQGFDVQLAMIKIHHSFNFKNISIEDIIVDCTINDKAQLTIQALINGKRFHFNPKFSEKFCWLEFDADIQDIAAMNQKIYELTQEIGDEFIAAAYAPNKRVEEVEKKSKAGAITKLNEILEDSDLSDILDVLRYATKKWTKL